MANIQTIRLIYYPKSLSEKEYIKTFLEFIGFQILDEPFQSNEEMVDILRRAASNYDLDIWLNLKPWFYDDDEYISTAYCSRAKNIIALDYCFSKAKNSQKYSVSVFSKESRKSDKIYEKVESKEELRKRVLEKLVEQLWYKDTEKQEEVKLIINSYVKHNIFVCMQALPELSIAGIISDDCRGNFYGYVHSTKFWEFCIKGFANFFNKLQPKSQSFKAIYTLYAYVNTAIIYLKLRRATRNFYEAITTNISLDYDSILSLLKKIISIDENFVGIWYLALLNSSLYRDKEWEIQVYLIHICRNYHGKVLNDKFISKFVSMLGFYFLYIGGNSDASQEYYLRAYELNERDIQANFMLANYYYAKNRRFSKAEWHLRKVLYLLCSPLDRNNMLTDIGTADYETLFKTCIWLAKLSFNKNGSDSYKPLEFIYRAITIFLEYQNAHLIGKIIDDEPVWNVLKEHYKNGTSAHKFYGILYMWAQMYHYNVQLQNVIKAIMPKQTD